MLTAVGFDDVGATDVATAACDGSGWPTGPQVQRCEECREAAESDHAGTRTGAVAKPPPGQRERVETDGIRQSAPIAHDLTLRTLRTDSDLLGRISVTGWPQKLGKNVHIDQFQGK